MIAREPDEQAPPIVDERYGPGGELATVQVVRGESAPPPSVLQFVKRVFGIGTVPVHLPERQNPIVQVGDENHVFVTGDALS